MRGFVEYLEAGGDPESQEEWRTYVERKIQYTPSPGRDKLGYWITTSPEYKKLVKAMTKPKKNSP